jgi:hypothetical protein
MISMNKKLWIAAFLVVLLSSTMFGTTWVKALTPGVTVGDSFIYDLTVSWNSDDQYASIPSSLIELNKTKSIEVRINNVIPPNVTTFLATYLKNGTALADRGSINLDTGLSDGGFVAIIAANLTAGDRVHPLGDDLVTINETVIKSYASGPRETNHIRIEYQNATAGIAQSVDRYFDKQTGMLVEEHDVSTETKTNPSSTTTTIISYNLESTSMWTVPEFPSVLILPLFMIATLLAAIAYKNKRISITKTLVPAKTREF